MHLIHCLENFNTLDLQRVPIWRRKDSLPCQVHYCLQRALAKIQWTLMKHPIPRVLCLISLSRRLSSKSPSPSGPCLPKVLHLTHGHPGPSPITALPRNVLRHLPSICLIIIARSEPFPPLSRHLSLTQNYEHIISQDAPR